MFSAKESSDTDQLKQFFGPPTNCHEVGQLGYTLNGYYLIKRRDDSNENGKIGVVYCRFQQLQKTNPSKKIIIKYFVYLLKRR